MPIAPHDLSRDPESSSVPPQAEPPEARWAGVSWVLLVLIGLCCGIELILMAADAGLIGTRLWRGLAYQNGAFWSGLLFNWRPNYPGQPFLMFLTYAFLHSGFWHLAGNMLTLIFLGAIVQDQVGRKGLVVLYGVAAIGGAVAFGLLNGSPRPMVGASGALFGLVGAWQYWEWADRRRLGQSRWPVWRAVLGFAVLNVVLWVMMDGALAWETHLGGFLAGWVCAVVMAWAGWGRAEP